MAIGFARGDGLPGNMVLALDLRGPMLDSSPDAAFDFGDRRVSVMDAVLTLDQASRDSRVKGVYVRVGTAGMSVPQAEEIGAALQRFRASGKFVIAHSQGFLSSGLGDYLVAANAGEIWMQPKSPFGAAGPAAGAFFLRGLFDKIDAVPQIAKRSDYKSAADMFMEKDYTPADREQTTALLQSWYDSSTTAAAADRKLDPKAVAAAFEASPQFADDARKAGLIDHIGYDDDAQAAAIARAGDGARLTRLSEYQHETENERGLSEGTHVALIEAAGEIVDGTAHAGVFGGSTVIAGDDLSDAIRAATKDKDIKAILLRIDSPGGSVTASDQILDALKKAQLAGKPVIVSMGAVAASGGYYVSAAADRIVAEPGTITGSIGVLTGKVSVGKSLALIGVGANEIGVGKNAMMDSGISPYTPDQWTALNAQADAIYDDFTRKVAAGRKLPLERVQDVAKGRVWSGADARVRGLVDELGGFWTAVDAVKKLTGVKAEDRLVFKRYPKPVSFFDAVDDTFAGSSAGVKALEGLAAIERDPTVHALIRAVSAAPQGAIELRATNLPAD